MDEDPQSLRIDREPVGAQPLADTVLLRHFLTSRDCPCPRCGYNLRDLLGNRCPECGDHLVLRVNMAEPRLAAMITGLVGFSAGAGFSGLLLVYFVTRWMTHNISRNQSYEIMLMGLALPFAIEGAGCFLWLRNWKALRRKSPAQQWRFATLAWLLTIVNLVYFTLVVR